MWRVLRVILLNVRKISYASKTTGSLSVEHFTVAHHTSQSKKLFAEAVTPNNDDSGDASHGRLGAADLNEAGLVCLFLVNLP